MPGLAVVGLQWGDEGKGKILDALASTAQVVVRYQGGGNAGHTVIAGDQKYVFHLMPTGALADGVHNIVGNGVALDLPQLLREIDETASHGIDVTGRLHVSERAHLVLPHHKALDAAREDIRPASGTFTATGERLPQDASAANEQPTERTVIGTTRRGIGPCYADKAARFGVRVVDALDADRFAAMLKPMLFEANALLAAYGAATIELDAVIEELAPAIERVRPLVKDTGAFVRGRLARGERVLFEGAQGAMLDIDHGTYPFVTSSNATALGIATGAGVPPRAVGHVIGVAKAYTTLVGAGPFPSELDGAEGEALRAAGHEFGATTGRPRRCGWFDAVAVRYATDLAGVDSICLTKLDVLAGRDQVPIVEAYDVDGERTEAFPASIDALGRARPLLRTATGPEPEVTGVRTPEAVPAGARAYVEAIETAIGLPVSLLSTGADRDALVRLGADVWESATS